MSCPAGGGSEIAEGSDAVRIEPALDHLVAELIHIILTVREMIGERLPAGSNGGADSIAGAPLPYALDDFVPDKDPVLLSHLFVY